MNAKRFFGAVMTLASASAAGQLIIIVAMPILTRLYTPESFGVLAVFASLLGVVLVVSSLRYELSIPLPRQVNSAYQLVIIALVINWLSAALLAIVVGFCRYRIAAWMDTPLLGELLWILPVGVVSGGTYKILNYWAVRNKDYRRIAITKLTQSSANVVAQIVGGLLGLGANALVVGQIIGQSVGITRLAKGLNLRALKTTFSKKRSVVLLSEYKNFPKYDAPAAAINAASAHLPNIAMALIFGPKIAGLYYLADRILAVPMSMISQAVGQVLFSQARDDIAQGVLKARAVSIIKGLLLLLVIPIGIVVGLAEPAFTLIFGESWSVAGQFASWLIFGLAMQFIYSPLSMILVATNGQSVNLIIQVVILFLKVGAFLLAWKQSDPLVTIQYLTVSMILGYGLGLVAVLLRVRLLKLVNAKSG